MTRTPIEDRLTAALAARAEQVRPEDLGPPQDLAQRRPTRASVVRALLAAAVVVGIVAAGVALWPRGGGVDAPPAGPTPSPTAPASPPTR